MHDRDLQMNRSRATRLKNLTAKKAECGKLVAFEEKQLKRLTNMLASPEGCFGLKRKNRAVTLIAEQSLL